MGFESRLAQLKDKFLSIIVRTIIYKVSPAHYLQGKSFKYREKQYLLTLQALRTKTLRYSELHLYGYKMVEEISSFITSKPSRRERVSSFCLSWNLLSLDGPNCWISIFLLITGPEGGNTDKFKPIWGIHESVGGVFSPYLMAKQEKGNTFPYPLPDTPHQKPIRI